MPPTGPGQAHSNNRPLFSYGLPQVDDLSVRKVVQFLASTMKRNVVVLELKSNLVKDERSELLQFFTSPNYKKTAVVVVGDPSVDYKKKIQAKMLEEKKKEGEVKRKMEEAKLKSEQVRKIAELNRKRAMEKAQKEMEKQKEEAEKKRIEAAKAAEKAAEEAAKAAEEKKEGEEGEA